MGHNICAIVGENPINEEKAREYGLAVIYECNFAIIPLDESSIYYWSNNLSLGTNSESEYLEWACEVTFHFAKEIGLTKYGIIQTDYWCGPGYQSASLYENGKSVLTERTINEILKELGVEREGNLDEFDTLNLGEYRSSEEYYWDSHNQAEGKSNMIPGRIIKN
jgi:hypothetical protein